MQGEEEEEEKKGKNCHSSQSQFKVDAKKGEGKKKKRKKTNGHNPTKKACHSSTALPCGLRHDHAGTVVTIKENSNSNNGNN